MNNTVPVFTIIVPVYNAAEYLPRCIDSVTAQTYKHFELLLINDGSTDSSGSICDAYAEKDNRVRVFHKENGGVSSARNLGIKEAIGTYITFVDSDDWIEIDFLEHFIKITYNEEPDLIVSGVIKYFDKYSNKNSKFYTEKANSLTVIPNLEEKNLLSGPFAKCFKTKVIRDSNVLFDERFHFGEDAILNLNFVKKINSIAVTDFAGYNYYQVPGDSLVKRKYSYEKTKEYIFELTQLRHLLLRKFNLSQSYNEYIDKQKTLYMISAIQSNYRKEFKKEKYERIKILRDDLPTLNLKLLPKGRYYKLLNFIFSRKNLNLMDNLLIWLSKIK